MITVLVPDKEAVYDDGEVFNPVFTFQDESDGNYYHISLFENKRYVLSKQQEDNTFKIIPWCFPWAFSILRNLPSPEEGDPNRGLEVDLDDYKELES